MDTAEHACTHAHKEQLTRFSEWIREGEECSKDVRPPWMIKRDMVEKVLNLEITRQGFKYWLPHVVVRFI